MKKFFAFFAVIALLASCSMYGPVAISGPIPVGKKVGKSTGTKFLGLGGDPSIKEAAENGGIETISTVEQTFSSYIIFNTHTITVTGN